MANTRPPAPFPLHLVGGERWDERWYIGRKASKSSSLSSYLLFISVKWAFDLLSIQKIKGKRHRTRGSPDLGLVVPPGQVGGGGHRGPLHQLHIQHLAPLQVWRQGRKELNWHIRRNSGPWFTFYLTTKLIRLINLLEETLRMFHYTKSFDVLQLKFPCYDTLPAQVYISGTSVKKIKFRCFKQLKQTFIFSHLCIYIYHTFCGCGDLYKYIWYPQGF